MPSKCCYSLRHSFARFFLVASCLVSLGIQVGRSQSPFELKDGDRVAFLGDTFVERSMRYGHIETALTARWPNREIVFRNIGWSGDNVGGRARAFFDPIDAGFENLKNHVQLADPSVILLSYGAMAAFEGEAGLEAFIQSYGTLINAVETGNRRLVILSPTPQEYMGDPMPDPKVQNQKLKLYTEALRSLAKERGFPFVDLFNTLVTRSEARGTKAITDNGVHLNDYGYTQAAERIVQTLTEYSTVKRLSLDKEGRVTEALGVDASASTISDGGLALDLQDERLSLSPLGGDHSQNLELVVANLPRGEYRLEHDGKVIATGSAQKWKRGIQLAWEPSNDQAKELRAAVNRKNEYFFHQWRPQNETYIRGFRKHEQGQNAADLPKFDPFIKAEEMKIAKLKKPEAYKLTLTRVKGGEG